MTDTTTDHARATLPVPGASTNAMFAVQIDWDDDVELHDAIRGIAAPVVAAELRRHAARFGKLADSYAADGDRARASAFSTACDELYDRVAELDPEG